MTLPKGISLPKQYDIVACAKCGFCYANTSAKKEDYNSYYTVYNNYSGFQGNESLNVKFPIIQKLVETHLRPSDSIADIGFGNGALLLRLRALGYHNLTGLDPSQNSVELGRSQGLNAFQRNIYDDAGCLRERFHAVFLTSVLEHLLYPKEGIQQACSYLRNNGYLFVEIPDYSMCDHVKFPIPNQFNQEHINYFSEISFANLLQGTGCHIVRSEGVEVRNNLFSSSETVRIFLLQKCAQEQDNYIRIMDKDRETRAAIERYLIRQESYNQDIKRVIADLCEKKVPLVIWGTGAMTMSLLASTDLPNCNIVAFTDGNPLKTGTHINDMEVISPEAVKNYPEATIFVCAMLYSQEIKSKIAELGLENHIISVV